MIFISPVDWGYNSNLSQTEVSGTFEGKVFTYSNIWSESRTELLLLPYLFLISHLIFCLLCIRW